MKKLIVFFCLVLLMACKERYNKSRDSANENTASLSFDKKVTEIDFISKEMMFKEFENLKNY